MLEMGLIVGLSLLISLAKMSWRWKMRVLSNPLLMDAIVFVFLIAIHWGTFSGVMVATIGAMVCSITISGVRYLVGYIENGKYVRGMWDVEGKL